MESLITLWQATGIANLEFPQLIMMLVGALLLYLAIVRNFGAVGGS